MHTRAVSWSRDRRRGCRSMAHERYTSRTWRGRKDREPSAIFAPVVIVAASSSSSGMGRQAHDTARLSRSHARDRTGGRVCENRAGGSRFRRCAADKKVRSGARRTYVTARRDRLTGPSRWRDVTRCDATRRGATRSRDVNKTKAYYADYNTCPVRVGIWRAASRQPGGRRRYERLAPRTSRMIAMRPRTDAP